MSHGNVFIDINHAYYCFMLSDAEHFFTVNLMREEITTHNNFEICAYKSVHTLKQQVSSQTNNSMLKR